MVGEDEWYAKAAHGSHAHAHSFEGIKDVACQCGILFFFCFLLSTCFMVHKVFFFNLRTSAICWLYVFGDLRGIKNWFVYFVCFFLFHFRFCFCFYFYSHFIFILCFYYFYFLLLCLLFCVLPQLQLALVLFVVCVSVCVTYGTHLSMLIMSIIVIIIIIMMMSC